MKHRICCCLIESWLSFGVMHGVMGLRIKLGPIKNSSERKSWTQTLRMLANFRACATLRTLVLLQQKQKIWPFHPSKIKSSRVDKPSKLMLSNWFVFGEDGQLFAGVDTSLQNCFWSVDMWCYPTSFQRWRGKRRRSYSYSTGSVYAIVPVLYHSGYPHALGRLCVRSHWWIVFPRHQYCV